MLGARACLRLVVVVGFDSIRIFTGYSLSMSVSEDNEAIQYELSDCFNLYVRDVVSREVDEEETNVFQSETLRDFGELLEIWDGVLVEGSIWKSSLLGNLPPYSITEINNQMLFLLIVSKPWVFNPSR